jgi:hypothetical protein
MPVCPVNEGSRVARAMAHDIPPLRSDGACGRVAIYRVIAIEGTEVRHTGTYTCALHIEGWMARGYRVEPSPLVIEEDSWTY